MNFKKCKVLVIRKPIVKHDFYPDLSLPDLQVVTHLKILGVIFNDKLTWSDHVQYTVKKCSRFLYAIRTLRNSLSPKSLMLFYHSLVRPLIEYCAPLFIGCSTTDNERLSRLQSRFHRIVCHKDCTCSLFHDVEARRMILCLRFLHQMMSSDHVLHAYLPPISKTGRFVLPYRRTQKRSKAFSPYAAMVFNGYVKRKL